MENEHGVSRDRSLATGAPADAFAGAAGALTAASVYTLLATIVLLSSHHASAWQLWLGTVPAALLAAATVLGGLARRRSRRDRAPLAARR